MKNPHIIVGEGRMCLCGSYSKAIGCGDILGILNKIANKFTPTTDELALLNEVLRPLVKDCDDVKPKPEPEVEFTPNWTLHRICPSCGEKSEMGCRCLLSDQVCKNGHHWYMCPVHHRTVYGQSDHSGNTIRCRCDSSAFYRT